MSFLADIEAEDQAVEDDFQPSTLVFGWVFDGICVQVSRGGCLGVNSSVQECAALEALEPPAVDGLEAWPLPEAPSTSTVSATATSTSTASSAVTTTPPPGHGMELSLPLALCALLALGVLGTRRRPQRRAVSEEEIEIPEVDRF